MTIWQDRAQIRELYREAERTLISNHTTTVWLPGSQDLDMLKLLSDLIGDQWVASSTVAAAPDGGLSISEGSERIDVAPPPFLRTLGHGTAAMLTGNTPPALIRTHAYYERHRWRRLMDDEQLARHEAMHDGSGHVTASRWAEKRWPDALPSPDNGALGTPHPAVSRANLPRGTLGRVLSADYPSIPCNRNQRRKWGPGGAAIPNEFGTDRVTGRPWISLQTLRRNWVPEGST